MDYYNDYNCYKNDDYKVKERFNEECSAQDNLSSCNDEKKSSSRKGYYVMSKEEFVTRMVKDLAIRKEMRERKIKEEEERKKKEEAYKLKIKAEKEKTKSKEKNRKVSKVEHTKPKEISEEYLVIDKKVKIKSKRKEFTLDYEQLVFNIDLLIV